MESFYSEPPMARSEVYPQPGVAYDARETVKTITEMAPKPKPPMLPVKERVERVQKVQVVQKPPPPVVEEKVMKAVRFCSLIVVISIGPLVHCL